MNKNNLLFAGVGVFVIIFALLVNAVPETSSVLGRYHQHLEQPGEEELGECTVCGGESSLCTHLPIIRIETGGQKIPGKAIVDEFGSTLEIETGDNGEEEIAVEISTVEEEDVWHHADDTPTITSKAMFRIRGNSSRNFDKSSYKITLMNEDLTLKTKESLLGMPSDSEWSLHGPFLDKTLIRNYMWMNIGAMMMGDAPEVRFCEVLIDGEYKGVYVLMELPTVSDSRTSLTKYEPGDLVMSYMVRIEPVNDLNPLKKIVNYSQYTFRMEEDKGIEIIYPGLLSQTEQVQDYINEDLSEIERRIYSADLAAGESFSDFLDLDSFVNYYLLQEFLVINDTFSASTYFYKDARGKLTAGPIWDYNNCLNNFFLELPVDELILTRRGWFAQLLKSSEFVEAVIDRWEELRESILEEAYLTEYIEQTQEWLGSAIDRNYEVWGYSFDPSNLSINQYRYPESTILWTPEAIDEMNPDNFEEATEWMVDFMKRRGWWMDEHIYSLRQYCHDSRNAALELD